MAGCNGGNLGIYTFLWPAATLRTAIQHTAIWTDVEVTNIILTKVQRLLTACYLQSGIFFRS
jgi:hypothetical protein